MSLQGGNANETEFRRQAPQAQYLHLATHGFFLRDATPQDTRVAGKAGLPFPDSAHVATNPMLRSGLALAGAQHTLEFEPDPEPFIRDIAEWIGSRLGSVPANGSIP